MANVYEIVTEKVLAAMAANAPGLDRIGGAAKGFRGGLSLHPGCALKDKYKTGFWIPSDGGKDIMSQDRWIGNTQIRNFMTLIKARSLVLISDSCFSGDLLS